MALRIIKYFKDLFDAPAPSAGKFIRWNGTGTALENADAGGGASSPLTLTANDAAEVPLTLKGATSQTANLAEFQNSSGTVKANVTSGGYFSTKAGILVDPAGYVETDFFQSATVYGAVPLTYMALVADGGSAVGHVLENYATGGVALANASAKLLSIRNGGVEKAYFDKDGHLRTDFVVSIDGNGVRFDGGSTVGYSFVIAPGGSLYSTDTYSLSLIGRIADGATAVGAILNNSVALTTAGAKLLSIRNNGVEKAYFDKDGKLYAAEFAIPSGGSSLVSAHVQLGNLGAVYGANNNPGSLIGKYNDGASAVGTVLDNAYALSTTGAKLVSIRNAGTEKAYFDKDGVLKIVNGIRIDGNVLYNSSAASINFGGDVINLTANVADGAASVSHVINNTTSLATSGAKLLSIRNANVEKASFDKDGVLVAGGINLVSASGTAYFYNVDVANSLTTGNLYLKYASQAIYGYDTDSLRLFGRCSNGATAVGVILDNNTYSLSTAGAKLVSIRNANSEKAFIDKDGGFAVASIQTFSAAALTLTSTVADGASAVGFIANTANALSNAGAKLLSIRNGSVEKVYFDTNGIAWTPGLNVTAGGYVNSDNYSVTSDSYITYIGGGSTDNASSLGHIIRTQYSYTVAGGKIASFRNNTTEKAFIDKDGGYVTTTGRISSAHFAPTYSASITIDATTGNFFTITATNSTAFTINAPTNPSAGQRITIRIKNTSGGALGTITWNAAFKMATFTSPATANSRSVTFEYDGTNWIETARAASDIPN